MPSPIIPQDQWETEFEGPLPGEPGIASAFRTLIQKVLNRTEWLRARLFAHRSASVLDHPDESVTRDKLAPNSVDATKIVDGAVTGTKIADESISRTKIVDGEVTAEKLAPVRNAPTIVPSLGDWLLGGLASGTGVGKLPIGLPNGVPFLNDSGALAASNAYLDRGLVFTAVDWDNLTEAGVYKIHIYAFRSGAANYPPTIYQFGVLLVFRSHFPAATVQIYIPHVLDDYIYFREAWYGTDWSAWKALGARYGSNSNGHYVRLADGTQICWAINVGAGPDPQTIIYPAAFAYPPAVVVTPADWPPAHISVDSMWGYETTHQRFRKYLADGSLYTGTAYGFNYVAIGRWK
jgi:hypothetical protein